MPSCCVVGCTNRTSKNPSLKFYKFPAEPIRRSKWMRAVNRVHPDGSPWEPGLGDRICSAHFSSGKKVDDPLHPGFCPSLLMGRSTCLEARFENSSASALGRHQRHVSRCQRIEEKVSRQTEVSPTRLQRIAPYEDALASANVVAKDVLTQTDACYLDPCAYESVALERDALRAKALHLERQLQERVLSHDQIRGNNRLTRFYTGLPTYDVFDAFVKYLEPKASRLTAWNSANTRTGNTETASRGPRPFRSMSVANQLIAVLARLRLALPALDICQRMGISEATYSRLFATWVPFLAAELKLLFPFPSREQVKAWMPRSFRKRYPNTRIIIDCYECQCQRPSGLLNQSLTYIDYKSRNTFKILLGCTPSGYVSFLLPVYGGRISDREITLQSGLVDLLDKDDMIMADRGFDIQEAVAAKGILINVPPKLGSRKQMTSHDVERTRIAEL